MQLRNLNGDFLEWCLSNSFKKNVKPKIQFLILMNEVEWRDFFLLHDAQHIYTNFKLSKMK